MTNFQKIGIALISMTLLLSVMSCSKSTYTPAIENIYGGISRDNNYESFPSLDFGSVSFEGKDSTNEEVSASSPPLSIGLNEEVFATIDSSIVAMQHGVIRWTKKTPGVILSGLCSDAEQNIYAMTTTGVLVSYSYTGVKRFELQVGNSDNLQLTSDVLCLQDGIVCASNVGVVMKVSYEGKPIWKFTTERSPSKYITADANGNVAVVLQSRNSDDGDSLCIIGLDGRVRSGTLFSNTRITTNLIWKHGRFFVGGEREGSIKGTPVILCINEAGTVIWSKLINDTPRSIACSNDTTLIVTGFNPSLQAIMSVVSCYSVSSGSLVWELYHGGQIVSPPMIFEDKVCFFAIQEKAIGLYSMSRSHGVLTKLYSISDAPLFITNTTVSKDGSIVASCTEKRGIVRIGTSVWKKAIPFM
jgi:hypothetical protein